MVVAVVAVLVSLLLPALGAAREAARAGECLAQLRQVGLLCTLYADEHRGVGPALGVPWESLPNWALVVQQGAGAPGDTAATLYRERSALVCPSTEAALRRGMTRTYAMNATGHAGAAMGDATSFDNPDRPGHVRFDLVPRPSLAPMAVDSAIAFIPDGAPPPTRTSSVLDFRQDAHVSQRLGRVHGAGAFHAVLFDTAARRHDQPGALWREPLP